MKIVKRKSWIPAFLERENFLSPERTYHNETQCNECENIQVSLQSGRRKVLPQLFAFAEAQAYRVGQRTQNLFYANAQINRQSDHNSDTSTKGCLKLFLDVCAQQITQIPYHACLLGKQNCGQSDQNSRHQHCATRICYTIMVIKSNSANKTRRHSAH
jgi:hypothetical protein